MADVIRYSEESVDALCASLEDMYAQMDDAARKLRNVRITRDTGGSVQISQTVRLSGGRSVGGESLLDFVAGLNRAMREEADVLHDLKMGLGKVRTIFDEEERDMAESLYIGDGTEVTERRIPYGGAAFVTLDMGNARPLGTLAASNPELLGKDDAQDLINFYLGDRIAPYEAFRPAEGYLLAGDADIDAFKERYPQLATREVMDLQHKSCDDRKMLHFYRFTTLSTAQP